MVTITLWGMELFAGIGGMMWSPRCVIMQVMEFRDNTHIWRYIPNTTTKMVYYVVDMHAVSV